ncbi:MAG: hypothetical protein ACRENK_16490 [Gemmatimonadaceae bacterium]
MDRSSLIALATDAARDPSKASRIAGWIADELQRLKAAGETATPPGYLYQGAFEWVITAENVVVEPLTGGPPITGSANPYIPLRVPFDALIINQYGWAEVASASPPSTEEVSVIQALASAEESRDLFSCSIAIDGQASFGTDGTDQLMFPASCVVGTRLHPRSMAWTLRRNQLIQVKFRNIANVYLDGLSGEIMAMPVLAKACVGFTVLNLGSP